MSNDREFRIKITADSSGAVKEVQGLSEATQKYINSAGPDLKRVQTAAEKVEISHHELRESIRKVTEISPELGLAARFALNPWIASLFLVTYGINQMIEKHKAAKAALEERISLDNIQRLIKYIGSEGLAKSLGEASVAAQSLFDDLEHIANSQTTIKEKTDAAIEALKRQADLSKGEYGAREQRDLAKVRADLASGRITPAEADFREQGVKDRYAKANADKADISEREIIEARQKEAELLRKKIADDSGDVAIRANAREEAKNDAERTQAASDKLKQTHDDQVAWIQKQVASGALTGHELEIPQNEARLSYQQYLTAQGKASQAKSSYETTQKNFEAFSKGLTDNETALKALTEQIAVLVATHIENRDSRAASGALSAETGHLETFSKLAGTDEGKAITSASATASAIESGKSVTDGQKEQLITLASLLSGHAVNLQQAIKLMDRAADTDAMLFKLIQDLDKRLQQLQSRINANRGHQS